MKISAFIAISWAVLILSRGAPAQESNGEMVSVDASVYANVEERPRKVELSQGAAKRPSAFSSLSSQPAKQLGTTAGWSAPATAPNAAGPGMARKSPFSSFQPGTQTHGAVPPSQASGSASYSAAGSAGKLRKPTKTEGTLFGEQVRQSSMFPEPRAPARPGAVQFEIQEFPSPFKNRKSGLTDNFSQADPFPGQGLKAKQRKPHPPRTTDVGAAESLRSAADGKH
jgi:hypothetical protein